MLALIVKPMGICIVAFTIQILMINIRQTSLVLEVKNNKQANTNGEETAIVSTCRVSEGEREAFHQTADWHKP